VCLLLSSALEQACTQITAVDLGRSAAAGTAAAPYGAMLVRDPRQDRRVYGLSQALAEVPWVALARWGSAAGRAPHPGAPLPAAERNTAAASWRPCRCGVCVGSPLPLAQGANHNCCRPDGVEEVVFDAQAVRGGSPGRAARQRFWEAGVWLAPRTTGRRAREPAARAIDPLGGHGMAPGVSALRITAEHGHDFSTSLQYFYGPFATLL
jgi:hypothetical protein